MGSSVGVVTGSAAGLSTVSTSAGAGTMVTAGEAGAAGSAGLPEFSDSASTDPSGDSSPSLSSQVDVSGAGAVVGAMAGGAGVDRPKERSS